MNNSDFLSPESLIQAGGKGKGMTIEGTMAAAVRDMRAEANSGFGKGGKRELELKFETSMLRVSGMVARAREGARGIAAPFRGEVEHRRKRLEEILEQRAQISESLSAISQTYGKWNFVGKARAGIAARKADLSLATKQKWHEGAKSIWEMSLKPIDWAERVLDEKVMVQYAKARRNLEATEHLRSLADKQYSQAFGRIGINDLFQLRLVSYDHVKRKLLEDLVGVSADEFQSKWNDLQGKLTETEMGSLKSFLLGKMSYAQRKTVKLLEKRITKITGSREVLDYQQLVYVRDTEHQVKEGKKLIDASRTLPAAIQPRMKHHPEEAFVLLSAVQHLPKRQGMDLYAAIRALCMDTVFLHEFTTGPGRNVNGLVAIHKMAADALERSRNDFDARFEKMMARGKNVAITRDSNVIYEGMLSRKIENTSSKNLRTIAFEIYCSDVADTTSDKPATRLAKAMNTAAVIIHFARRNEDIPASFSISPQEFMTLAT